MSTINRDALLSRFLDYVQIDSETGDEGAMSARVAEDCKALGFEVTTDEIQAVAKTTGCNVYVTLPGDDSLEPILFSAHLDTVVPGKGIVPRVDADGRVRSAGETILGADDKAGVCAILEAMIAAKQGPHRTVEALFTVREESGMGGAKNVDYSRIKSKHCVGLDGGGGAESMITNAPGQNKIYATVTGRKAHAGAAPEAGISAIMVAAHAVTAMQLLRVDFETTANIGTFLADGPTNIVADTTKLIIEVRSRNDEKLSAHTQHIIDCLTASCEQFGAGLDYNIEYTYSSLNLGDEDPLVKRVIAAAKEVGVKTVPVATGGGSDANIFNKHGLTAVNIGVGMEDVHTCDESLVIADMCQSAEVCLRLMQP